MKTNIFLLFTLISAFSLAGSFQKDYSSYSCFKKIKKEIKNKVAANQGVKVFDPIFKIRRYPTSKIGSWIQVKAKKNKIEGLAYFDSKKVTIYNINDKCKLKKKRNKKQRRYANSSLNFNDNDLEQIIKDNKKGLIYILNPSFTYSIKFLEQARVFASSKNMSFTPLLPYRYGSLKKKKIKVRQLASLMTKVRVNTSNEIKMRGLELHSPSYLFFKNGKIVSSLIGVQDFFSLNRFYINKMKRSK